MKRCPQCKRVEPDDALKFCRVDGVMLISDSLSFSTEAGTAEFGSTSASTEIETSILPYKTDSGIRHAEAATTVLPVRPAPARLTSTARYALGGLTRHKAAALFALIIACGGLAYAVYHFTRASKSAAVHFQSVKLTRLTAEGNVESATVSPDGKYIAYSLEESGRR